MVAVEDLSHGAELVDRLERLGFAALAQVSTGEDCVQMAGQARPELVLMDLALAGPMDALEAAAWLRSCLYVPVVFLASQAEDSRLERIRDSEPFGYLLEPFDDKSLQVAMDVALFKARMEAKLRQSEEHFRSFVENANDIIYSSSIDGVFSYVSPNWTDIVGHDRAEIVGQPIISLVHPDDVQAWRDFIAGIVEDGRRISGFEYRIRYRDGSWRWHSTSGSPMTDDQGNVFSFLGIARDVTARVQAEAALKESEERFRAIFSSVALGMALVDMNGQVMEVNTALAEMLGYSQDELLITPIAQVTHPDDLALDLNLFRDLTTGIIDHYLVVKRYLRRDGAIVWGNLTVSLVRRADGSPRFAIAVVEDISAQHQAAEDLRQSEERFRTVADFTYDLEIWRDPRGRILYVSPSCERITGYTREELFDHPELAMEMILPEDRTFVSRHLEAEFNRDEVQGIEFRIRTKDGQLKWIGHFCQPVYGTDGVWLGRRASNRDISSHKELADQLRSTNQRYRALIQSLPMGVLSVDKDFRITEWNHWAEAVTGFEEKEVLGAPCLDTLGCDGGLDRCLLRQAVASGTPMGPAERTIRHRDGRSIPVRMMSAPLFDPRGRIVGGVETFQDISDVKALERERANVTSMLVHDMKSPLISIQGLARRLFERPGAFLDQKGSKYVEIIFKEAGKLEELIRDFLELSRLQTGRLRLNIGATDLAAELDELVESFQPRFAQAGVRLQVRITPDLEPIPADAPRLRRVFTNLLENALKHSPAETSVNILTRTKEQEVLIQVIDEGEGITPEDLPRIFDPFFRGRTGEGYRGHGLGLAVVKAIVMGHGGQVRVSSHPGRGSTFTISLPSGGGPVSR